MRRWQLYHLERSYRRFIKEFYVQLDHLRVQPQREGTHNIVHLWKTYLEHLEKRPYSKLTTAEICHIEENKYFQKPLQNLDRAMYGHSFSKEALPFVEELVEIARTRYAKKKENI